jgi:hypothetical protein
MSEADDYMGSRFALLGRLRHSRMRIDRRELVGDLTTIGRHADAKIETMGMLRAMVRRNVTPGKRLNNPPSDDSAFEVHLRFDSEAECVAYADMRPWPDRPVQQTVPPGSENFQLHIPEHSAGSSIGVCTTPARLLLWRAPMRTVEGRHPQTQRTLELAVCRIAAWPVNVRPRS